MKPLQDTQAASDRISTREELCQVLDLLIGLRDPDQSRAAILPAAAARLNRDPYAEPVDLWSDMNNGQEPVLASDMTTLEELLLLGRQEGSN
jgi:hypothetical protein